MSITAYRDPGFGAIELGGVDNTYSCYCGRETPVEEMHAHSIRYGPGGHCIVDVGEDCNACSEADTSIRIAANDHHDIELHILEWLSSAAGSRIVWKVEDHGTLPTSWTCVIADVPPEWAPTPAAKLTQNPFPYMELRRESFSNYAFSVVPSTTEDSTSTFRPDLAEWSYFEDWLERERGLQLSQLLDQ